MTTDVIIVGGGIVGVTAAWDLARRGATVALLEKADIAAEQSGRNWGFIRRQGRDPEEIGLAARSNERYAALEDDLGEEVGWIRGGNLRVAPDAAKVAQYRAWYEKTNAGETLGTRLITGAEVGALIPGMSREWVGGIYTANDGHADPDRLTRAVARAATRAGASVATGVTATRIATSDHKVTGVETSVGRKTAGAVLVAAGIWTPTLMRGIGVRLPLRWVRNTVALTAPLPHFTDLAVWTPDVAFRQRRDGRVVLGNSGGDFDITIDAIRNVRPFLPNYLANWRMFQFHLGGLFVDDLARRLHVSSEGRDRFRWRRASDPPANRGKVATSHSAFTSLFPGLPTPMVERSWAGYIDASPDQLPVIGAVNQFDGLYVAAGFSGHGFGLGPAVGEALAELITVGRSSIDLDAMKPSRFSESDYRVRGRAVT